MAYNTIVLILGIAIGEDNVEESSDRKNLRHYPPYEVHLSEHAGNTWNATALSTYNSTDNKYIKV
jgi:hypothetical protein